MYFDNRKKSITEEQKQLEDVELKAVQGTMKLHTMMFRNDKIYYRDLRCRRGQCMYRT